MALDFNDVAEISLNQRAGNGEAERHAAPVISDMSMTIEVIRDVGKFSSLHDRWNCIAGWSAAAIFQTHEWLFLWWKHFGDGGRRSLHILIVRENETIVGIIPLFMEVHTLFGFELYKRLRLLGCGITNGHSYSPISEYGPSDFLDFIALPRYQCLVAEMFLKYLDDHPSLCDEITLEYVPDESIVKKELAPLMKAAGTQHEIRRMDSCPRLNTPPSVEEHLQGLRPAVRRRLQQAHKAISAAGGSGPETITPENLPGAFLDLVALHQGRWNRLGYPGLFQDPRFELFQSELWPLLCANGWIWLKAVCADGVRIAIRMGMIFNERMYDYLSGFDERSPSSKQRPGLGLLLAMMEDAIRSRCRVIELLRGNEAYKFELTSEFMNSWTIRIMNQQSRHAFRSWLYVVMKFFGDLILRLSKERQLFVVQIRVHGLTGGLFHYLSFRNAAVTGKVHSLLKSCRQVPGAADQKIVTSAVEP